MCFLKRRKDNRTWTLAGVNQQAIDRTKSRELAEREFRSSDGHGSIRFDSVRFGPDTVRIYAYISTTLLILSIGKLDPI